MDKRYSVGRNRVLVYLVLIFTILLLPSQNLLAQYTLERDSLENIVNHTDDPSERIKALAYLTINCAERENCLDSLASDYFKKLTARSSSFSALDKHYVIIAEAFLVHDQKYSILDSTIIRDSVLNSLDQAYESCIALQNSELLFLVYRHLSS